jgi:Ca-activated chloride channel homolog
MRLGAFFLFAWLALAQETPVFKTDVSLVHLDAEVAAQDGRILTGFTKDDFRVLDEGKEQRILHFSAGEEALDLILLFDISGSMRPKVQQVAAAAREGVQELRPGDRVAIMVFNTRTRLLTPFSEDLEAVQRSIQDDVLSLQFGGGTFIQSAVSDAAKRLMREPRSERRRAVLIITDDYGQRTRRESTVVGDLWEADALLTGLIVRSTAVQTLQTLNTIMHPVMLGLQVGVRGIAEKTGGDFIHAGDPAAGFQESMHRIRSRYSIYYAMPNAKPGSRRSLHVELSADAAKRYPKSKVRARTGYIVPAKD